MTTPYPWQAGRLGFLQQMRNLCTTGAGGDHLNSQFQVELENQVVLIFLDSEYCFRRFFLADHDLG